jgi:hypothetical protein
MTSDATIVERRVDPGRTELPRNPGICVFERAGADQTVACVSAPVTTNLKALT